MKSAPASGGEDRVWPLVPVPKPDETAWGHLHRVAAVNNFDSAHRLVAAWSGNRQDAQGFYIGSFFSQQTIVRTLRLLASAKREERGRYEWRHGLGYMLASNDELYEGRLDYYGKSVFQEQAGLLPDRRRARFCRTCQREAVNAEGFSWYLRIHQVAGIEVCPFHFERLRERPLDLKRILSTQLAPEVQDADYVANSSRASVISCYEELVKWRWGDASLERLVNIRDLVSERAKASGCRLEELISKAMEELADRKETTAWYGRHFNHLPSLYQNRKRGRPMLSLFHFALALASHGDSIDDLLPHLERKRIEAKERPARFLGRRS